MSNKYTFRKKKSTRLKVETKPARRPLVQTGPLGAPIYTREMGRLRPWPAYTLEQVAQHAHKDDCWIVVNDKVYDMTPHVRNHEGWIGSGKISTLLAILSAMGTDCTDDFNETHDANGFKELNAFQIGVLDKPNTARQRIRYYTWEELVASGCISDCPGAKAAAKKAATAVVAPTPAPAPAPAAAIFTEAAALCEMCEASPCADGCPARRSTFNAAKRTDRS